MAQACRGTDVCDSSSLSTATASGYVTSDVGFGFPQNKNGEEMMEVEHGGNSDLPPSYTDLTSSDRPPGTPRIKQEMRDVTLPGGTGHTARDWVIPSSLTFGDLVGRQEQGHGVKPASPQLPGTGQEEGGGVSPSGPPGTLRSHPSQVPSPNPLPQVCESQRSSTPSRDSPSTPSHPSLACVWPQTVDVNSMQIQLSSAPKLPGVAHVRGGEGEGGERGGSEGRGAGEIEVGGGTRLRSVIPVEESGSKAGSLLPPTDSSCMGPLVNQVEHVSPAVALPPKIRDISMGQPTDTGSYDSIDAAVVHPKKLQGQNNEKPKRPEHVESIKIPASSADQDNLSRQELITRDKDLIFFQLAERLTGKCRLRNLALRLRVSETQIAQIDERWRGDLTTQFYQVFQQLWRRDREDKVFPDLLFTLKALNLQNDASWLRRRIDPTTASLPSPGVEDQSLTQNSRQLEGYYDIFLMHSSNSEYTRGFQEICKRHDWKVKVFDRAMSLGDPKYCAIEKILENSSHLVILITADDCARYRNEEMCMTVEMALQRGHLIGELAGRVIPIRCCEKRQLPLVLMALTGAHITDPSLEERLVITIDTDLRKSRESAAHR